MPAPRIHGMTNSKEYRAYQSAKTRCTNPKYGNYAVYGGRGIEFRFLDFAEFLTDVGLAPSALHSLDRIDSNGHYERGNVRWSTIDVQMKNRKCSCPNCTLSHGHPKS